MRVVFGVRKEQKHIQPEMGLGRVSGLPGALQPSQHTLTEPGAGLGTTGGLGQGQACLMRAQN